MADLPQINKTVRLPVAIAVFPYWQDHRIEGKAVLPAVEAMRLVAHAVKEFAHETDVTAARDMTFDKFLFIPPAVKKIDALCSITMLANGDIGAVLQTKTWTKTGAFTRIKDHVTVLYPAQRQAVGSYRHDPAGFRDSSYLKISADQIYRELVPFGPAYRNIADKLSVCQNGAMARLRAPLLEHRNHNSAPLGSPFVLDAAFHCACVWGQRYKGMVAFPVGIEERIIVKPTRPGDTYIASALPVRTESDMLIFDIHICDEDNTLCEKARGVHMRDVSAGRLQPPAWIIAVEEKNPNRTAFQK